jgi:hypothetical protein
VVKQGQLLPMHVRVGANEVMQPVAQRDVSVVVPKKDAGDLKLDFAVPTSLYGPLVSDQTVGEVIVRNHSEVVATFNAVSPNPVGQQPFAVGQQPAAAVDAASAPAGEVANERGATIRVASPANQAAAPMPAAAAASVNAAMAPMNTAAAPIDQTVTPVR